MDRHLSLALSIFMEQRQPEDTENTAQESNIIKDLCFSYPYHQGAESGYPDQSEPV
jgi:hypothetical protein